MNNVAIIDCLTTDKPCIEKLKIVINEPVINESIEKFHRQWNKICCINVNKNIVWFAVTTDNCKQITESVIRS